jgi:hypothetical protein
MFHVFITLAVLALVLHTVAPAEFDRLQEWLRRMLGGKR